MGRCRTSPVASATYYGPDRMVRDLFRDGYVDMGIFQPTYLSDFYEEGFNTTEQNAELATEYPERFVLNGSFDPRDGDKGLQYLDEIDIDDTDIDDTDIDGTGVRVRLRLPTAWCSPAFAWLMASDARDAVGAIPGVDGVTIRLIDHMHAEEITDGVNADLPFDEAFAEADDDVEAVRRKLDTKARLRRQYEATTALLDAGLTPEQAATLRREDVVIDETVGRASLQLSGLAIALDADPLVE